jgi:hypothetical protein
LQKLDRLNSKAESRTESRTSKEPSEETVLCVRERDEFFRCNILNMRERGLGGGETRSLSERLPVSGKVDSGSAVKLDGGMSSPSADRLLRRFERNRADSLEGLSAPSPFACNNLPGICVSI